MAHLSEEMSLAYYRNQLNMEERLALEDHLAQCDQCLIRYLALVETEMEMEPAVPSLSSDFTQGVLNAIKKPVRKKSKGISRRQLLKYYTIAASLTLILTASGVFRDMGGHLTQASEELVRPESIIQIQYPGRLTEWLIDSTARFTDSIINRLGSDQINE